ncbi:MAG: NADH-quinone oxidoreductase subunit L [Chloroflexi bacterium]|nr:NADH-quinone oxidoreductase subunit L [Chloroflexota bacterium]
MDINWLDANYLPWLIFALPLLSFVVITLFIGRYKMLSGVVAAGAVFVSWLLAWAVFFKTTATEEFGINAYGSSFEWMDLGAAVFRMGVLVDPLTAVMLFMVPLAMLMIFIYSLGYMAAYPHDDPHHTRFSRFFAYLSLFAGAMLTLVVSDNLLLLFMGWEVMGLCSYLLIGFIIERKSAYQAAVKAFMTTRVADVFFLVGIGYLFAETQTLNFREIFWNPAVLERLGNPEETGFIGLSAAAIIGSFIVLGTFGKAAQFPFHGWLPDAMEGPTPVSAMIHAAAMVSAGVFLVVRMFPLLEAGGQVHHGDYTLPLILMGVVGSVTALGAAMLGVAQNDIKRVLAYSTISQLGFMIAALGIGAYIAAAFHLITHAFFKALLFMSSGAVIHAMEHGEHHAHDLGHHDLPHRVQPGEATPWGATYVGPEGDVASDEEWQPHVPDGIQLSFVAVPNDLQFMGGLGKRIPVTKWAMLAGTLSLAGAPLITAGFWSKDEIFADSLLFLTDAEAFDLGAAWLHMLVFTCLVFAATLTAFYSMRMWFLAFTGEPRSIMAEHATLMSGHHSNEHEHDEHQAEDHDHEEHHEHKVAMPWQPDFNFGTWWATYRDSALMQGPLVVLAFFAITAGWVGIHPDFPILRWFTGSTNYYHDFVGETLLEHPETIDFSWIPVLFSFVAFGIGATIAWFLYGREPLKENEQDPMIEVMGQPAWVALQNRLDIDNVWLRIFYMPFEIFARRVVAIGIDKETIDGLLEGIGEVATFIGETFKRFNRVFIDGVGDGIPMLIGLGGNRFRNIQSGRIQQYLLFTALFLIAIGAFFVAQAL